ncbi:hypothetical protein [Clostridium sp. E02]|uniref:hypothetical protein n=1 Tax=Clostridium sp. E02 TaxID=2487134 RepID=UPI000F52853A|nr:hypothetical protein [Clostridium sp. E02]
MRYFMIYADKRNPQPRFLDWYTQMRPGRSDRQIYEELSRQNHFQIELNRELSFMDLICHPCFMVSKELAALIRIYSPEIQFKYATLFDKENRRSAYYQIPNLPELDCLDAKSEVSKDRSVIMKGILKKEKIQMHSIFRLGGIKGRYLVADLNFVESAYRREVMGMRIEEFMIE